ncbi:tyrosine-type recombinase/integrase [Halorussus litoreus]|uniref:tyrosine-type recombinase/integrase n=1 Tax=Halorussus litoreus TaxID=1710536 RepID=UPI000E26165A|nr:site-specific integrase [Halorussus litoreus]
MSDFEGEDKLDEILRHVDPRSDLDSVPATEAVDKYLESRSSEVTGNTRSEYEAKLGNFIEFCDQRDIEQVKNLDGAALDDLKVWIREEVPEVTKEYSPKTMRDQMYLLRNFLRYLEQIEAVPAGLHEKVDVPELESDDGVSDEFLEAERVRSILDHLSTFEYASREHVVWLLLSLTGGRKGAIHSLDVDDCHVDGENYIEFRHRPEQGTRLKNGMKSEREVSIPASAAEAFSDYVETTRIGVTDDYERRPLLTTKYGRVSKSTLTKDVYKWSRPCMISDDCPHERSVDECSAATNLDVASKCPSSASPHRVRTGYLTTERKNGAPKEVLSERCDVSESILEKHYEFLSEEEQRKMRQRILKEVRGDSDGYAG